MRNKKVFENKMDRIEGKLQNLKTMITRNVTIQDLRKNIEDIEELLSNMRDMLERE